MLYAEAAHRIAESAEKAFCEADKKAIRNFLEGPVQEAIIRRMNKGMFSTAIEYYITSKNSEYNIQFLDRTEAGEYIKDYLAQYGFTVFFNIPHNNTILLRIFW